jgi:arylsulfatase A-like enzyme
MSRNRLLALVVVVAFLAVGGWLVGARSAAQPNVVLVVIDTLRADHLGAYGYDRPTSPELDRLAASGVRFSRFFSNCSWTRPSMATLITGQYARTVGVYEEAFDVLPEDATTLAERLRDAGWVTLGLTSNPNTNSWFQFDQGFDAHFDSEVVWHWMPADESQRFNSKDNRLVPADRVTDKTLALVDEHAGRLRGAPFYLQVLYIDPHLPNRPPREHLDAVGAQRGRVAKYDGEVHFVDAEVGRLLRGLERRGHLKDALVVVTSDHGEGLRDHPWHPLGTTHGHHLYDSVLHVPLIVAHPRLDPGRVVGDLAASIDLVPTILDFVGLPPDPSLPGHSLVPLLDGSGPVQGLPERIFAETEFRYTQKAAVRTESHKVVRNEDSAALQQEGIHEGRNLGTREREALMKVPPTEAYRMDGMGEHPGNLPPEEVVDSLAASLEEWLQAYPARAPERRDPNDVITLPDGSVVPFGSQEEMPDLDASMAEQLRALGYLGGADTDEP